MPISPSRSDHAGDAPSRVRRALRRGVLPAALLTTGACHTWQQARLTDPDARGSYTQPVRVTVAGGSVLTLCSATLTADSLVAGPCGTTTIADSAGRVALSRRDIVLIEERRFSDRRTLGLVLGSLTAVALAAAATIFIALATWSWE
jgi:hypothetical protein